MAEGTTANNQTGKRFLTTALLSLFLGGIGVDRFYLGKVGTGILKLMTFGGFGIWYLIDLILILAGSMKDKRGNELVGREKDLKTALIVTGIFFAIGILISSTSAKNAPTTTVKTVTTTPEAPKEEKKDTTAKIGQAVRDGKFEFTVTKIECGQPSVGSGYLTKSAQGQYCFLSVSVKNIGDESQSLLSSNQYLYNASGQKFAADDVASMYTTDGSSSWYSNINPGNSVSGIIVFDLPKDQTPIKAMLHDSAFSGGASVNLQ